MQKADFGAQPDRSQENERKIRSLKENRSLLQIMEKNHLPAELLERSPWRISRWYEEFQPCLKCKGLFMCGQKQKGYFNNLEYDGLLQTVQTACRFERERIREEAHMENYLVSDLPAADHTIDFRKIDTSGEDEEYLQVLDQAMTACTGNKGLYLYGTMGSGKTYLAACACNYHARMGEHVAFIHYPSFCRRMADGIATGEFRTEFSRVSFAKFLVIDDIGAESVTEWNRDQILLPLLSSRYEEGLPTWFTSNEDLKSLEKHFRFTSRGKEEEIKSARIIERIEHLSSVIEVIAKNRRKSF